MEVDIVKITFDEIYPIWDQMLWPNRESQIEPVSILQFDLSYDPDISQFPPTFFACKLDGKIIGVNSGFKTAHGQYRSRGLYVYPEHRGLGLSKRLLKAVEDQAVNEDCYMIWTIPRQNAMPAYASSGYIQVTNFFTDGMEFGPNCIAAKYINNIQC